MKYKIAHPEDYPEIDEYQFKLSRAYSKLYSDFLSVLTVIDVVLDNKNLKDPIVLDVAIYMLQKVLDEYKSSE